MDIGGRDEGLGQEAAGPDPFKPCGASDGNESNSGKSALPAGEADWKNGIAVAARVRLLPAGAPMNWIDMPSGTTSSGGESHVRWRGLWACRGTQVWGSPGPQSRCTPGVHPALAR